MPAPVKTRLAESNRVEAFSDGVFAVAITILVLELHAPSTEGEFLQELLGEWQTYVAYVAAFLIIGVIWLTHHALFTRIDRVDTRLMIHNLAQLLLASLVPFAASVVSNSTRDGSSNDQLVAVLLFSIVSLALSLNWYLLCAYVETAPQLLVDESSAAALRRERRWQPLTFIPSVLAGLAALLLAPIWGMVVLALLPVYYLVATRRAELDASQ